MALTLTHGGALSTLLLFPAIDAGLLARGRDVVAPALDSSTIDRVCDGAADVGTTGFALPVNAADDVNLLVAVSGLRVMALLGRTAGLGGQPARVDLRELEGTILDRWITARRLAGRSGRSPPSGVIDLGCIAAAIERELEAQIFTSERISHVH